VVTSGKERDEEWREIFTEAGFMHYDY